MRAGIVVLGTLVLAACNNGKTYTSRGEVDTARDTAHRVDTSRGLSMPSVSFGTKKDTVNVPVVSMEKDTVVVSKPVITGHKQVEVTRPTVNVKKKP